MTFTIDYKNLRVNWLANARNTSALAICLQVKRKNYFFEGEICRLPILDIAQKKTAQPHVIKNHQFLQCLFFLWYNMRKNMFTKISSWLFVHFVFVCLFDIIYLFICRDNYEQISLVNLYTCFKMWKCSCPIALYSFLFTICA